MYTRIAALALALFTVVGCDSSGDEGAPAEGSCQALVDEIIEIDDCNLSLGKVLDRDGDPDESAGCAAEVFELEEPPEDMVSGLAYQVAYTALCEIHGNTAADFCGISETLGCEG